MKIFLILFLNIFAQISFSEGQVYLTPQKVQEMTFDYIIVGGGTGGATVAKRLSEKEDLQILIIEAGGRPGPLTDVPALFLFLTLGPEEWQYPIEPQTECFKSTPGQKFNYAQGKMLGGSSSHNAMMYVRGSKENYDSWAASGLTEWSNAKVLPFFIKAEDNTIPEQMNEAQYHGTQGPVTVSRLSYVSPMLKTFIDGGNLIGLPLVDYNGANQTGIAEIDFTIRNGSRCSTYVAYLNAIPTQPNLFITIYSTATRITFSNKTATGVEFVNNGQIFYAKAKREVIISCGSLSSPKLLMLSGIGQRKQLEIFNITVLADRPGVGKKLYDHVANMGLVVKVNCTCTYQLADALSLEGIVNYEIANAGTLSSPLGVEGTAFFKSNQSLDANDIQFIFYSNSFATMPAALSLLTEADINIVTQYYAPFANATNTVTIFVTNVQPKSEGYVRLNSSNPLDYPIVNFNYLKDRRDVIAFIEGMKMAKKLIDSKAFQSVGAQLLPGPYPGCENYTIYTDKYWDCFIRGLNYLMYHPVGTCAMGLANDRMAVVDQYLKVIGVNNLRVVDASVIPYITSGNTNAPTNMIGERAAAFIKSGK